MNKRINYQIIFVIGLVLLGLMFALVNHPPIANLWEGTRIYADFRPDAGATHIPFLAIQKGGDSEGYHGHGYAFLIISRYVAEIFGSSLFIIKFLPILYGLIGAILLYIICNRWFEWRVATIATALLLTNISFIYFQHSDRSQTISLAAVLFCIERLQNFIKKGNLSAIITMGIACALAAMHYIVGRIAMLTILLFYLFDPAKYWLTGSKEGILNDFVCRFKNVCKIILSMVAVLAILFPPNIFLLFNKNFIAPSFIAEVGTGSSNIFYIIWHNIVFFVNFYILGNLGGHPSDLMLDLPYPLEQKVVFGLCLVGIVIALRSFRKMEMRLLLFLSLILLSSTLFCSYYPYNEYVTSSSMMTTRLLILLPFICIFAALGVDYIYKKVNKMSQWIKTALVLLVILSFVCRIGFYFAEVNRFEKFMDSFKYDYSKPAIEKKDPDWGLMHDYPMIEKRKLLYNQIYFHNLAQYLKNEINQNEQHGNGIKLIYVPADHYTPDYYRFGGGSVPWKGKTHPYYFPMYLTLYLGDQGVHVTYLIKRDVLPHTIRYHFDRLVRRVPIISGLWQYLTKNNTLDITDQYVTVVNGLKRPEYILVTTPEELRAAKTLTGAKIIIQMPKQTRNNIK